MWNVCVEHSPCPVALSRAHGARECYVAMHLSRIRVMLYSLLSCYHALLPRASNIQAVRHNEEAAVGLHLNITLLYKPRFTLYLNHFVASPSSQSIKRSHGLYSRPTKVPSHQQVPTVTLSSSFRLHSRRASHVEPAARTTTLVPWKLATLSQRSPHFFFRPTRKRGPQADPRFALLAACQGRCR